MTKTEMFVLAVIAGLDQFALFAIVEPHDTIATVLDQIQEKLRELEMPHEFTGAYSLEYTQRGGLMMHDPDYIALGNGDPDTTARYLTPSARLDPKKTVKYYFGTSVQPEAASIIFTWPAASLAQEKRKGEPDGIGNAEYFAESQGTKTEPTPTTDFTPLAQTIERQLIESQTSEDANAQPSGKASLSQWFACVPWAACLNAVGLDTAKEKNQ